MEYHSSLKRNGLLTYETTCMGVKNIILKEGSRYKNKLTPDVIHVNFKCIEYEPLVLEVKK